MEQVRRLAEKLQKWYTGADKVAIALSGGIDSSLVAYTARRALGKEHVVAIISASASVKQRELNDARKFCKQYDIKLEEIDAEEINDMNYSSNPVNRCFFCKSALYHEIEQLILEQYSGYSILNGNNFSDLGDFRPGIEAAKQHRVYSPLAECKYTKDDIRLLAKHYGLPNWNKPASPCLSSRFPYGESISVEKLKKVEIAEDLLHDYGFIDVRVRYRSKKASIEVPADQVGDLREIFDEVLPKIKSFGFDNVEIDAEGLVSGKLNRGIIQE